MADLRLDHWRTAKKKLQYLKGTINLRLEYGLDLK